MELADINLVCRQCGKEFLFSIAEQEYYTEKGFDVPHHCKTCRADRRNKVVNVCSKCGNKVETNTAIYCGACYASLKLNSELDASMMKNSLDESEAKLAVALDEKDHISEYLNLKLLAIEAEKTQLVSDLTQRLHNMESQAQESLKTTEMKLLDIEASNVELRKLLQEEKQLTASLQDQLSNTGNELEKSNKYRTELDSVGPAFKTLIERFTLLEHAQNDLNKTVQQMVRNDRENSGPVVFLKRILHINGNNHNKSNNIRELSA